MCEAALIEPLRDNESRLPIPFPMGTSLGTQAFTSQFAVANFETRNLVSKKCTNIKMVMTEEALDDWEAQTLNIPYEKLVRHKKTMKNVGGFPCLYISLFSWKTWRGCAACRRNLWSSQPLSTRRRPPARRNHLLIRKQANLLQRTPANVHPQRRIPPSLKQTFCKSASNSIRKPSSCSCCVGPMASLP
jgi:hypothetical protein